MRIGSRLRTNRHGWTRGARWAFGVLVASALSSIIARSDTLVVPSEVGEIPAAVTLAQQGDTVLVLPGWYELDGRVVFSNNSVVFRGSGKGVTTIVGGQSLFGTFDIGADSVTVEHFTLLSLAAGVYVRDAKVECSVNDTEIILFGPAPGIVDKGLYSRVTGNEVRWAQIGILAGAGSEIIENNVYECSDGGVVVFESNVHLIRNHIWANSAYSTTPFGTGGGIDVYQATNVTIEENHIHQNWVDGNSEATVGNGKGGGIAIQQSANVRVANNTIVSNEGIRGGGIYVSNSHVIIEGNLVHANRDSSLWGEPPVIQGHGGGLFVENITGLIRNNTIDGNAAALGGGGMYCSAGCEEVVMEQNIMSNNRSTLGGGVLVADGAGPIFTCNDSWANQGGNYEGVADPTGLDGNFSANPGFCEGDQPDSLRSDSPCADYNVPWGCSGVGAFPVGCWIPAGVRDLSAATHLGVWPNPSHGAIYCRVNGIQLNGGWRLIVRSPDGREVARMVMDESVSSWDGTDANGRRVASGVYYLEASGAHQSARSSVVMLSVE